MRNFLFDTSVVIDYLRKKDKEQTLFYKLSTENVFISIVTHTELYAGKSAWENIDVKKWLAQFFDKIVIMPLSKDVSKLAGYIKAHNQSNFTLDAIIAATAIEYDYEFVTLNAKDFKKIPNLKLFEEHQSKN